MSGPMIDLDQFQRRVSHVARGCPTAVLRDAILQAGEDFCERTWIWKDTVGPVVGEEDRAAYTFAPPRGAAILAVSEVLVDGLPAGFTSSLRDTVNLHAAPRDGQAITALAALKPSRTAKALPAILFNEWQDAIAAGARYKLLSMAGTDWFQPQLADQQRLEFERLWVPRARVEVSHRQGRPLTVHKRRFI